MYHQIFSALVSKPMINVYTDDKEYRKVFATSKRMVLSGDPEKSDIILITNREALFQIMRERQWTVAKDEKPILIVTNYRLLKNSFDIVGAFYWRKGRSQLLFIKNRLNAYNITLPDEYKDFQVDTL
ncbi:MAG TPA: hypothetical protein ENI25_00770 [Epsilonproteobacteria bacterium]|nr:hypothetical protein [Campylobacterota bacterium]